MDDDDDDKDVNDRTPLLGEKKHNSFPYDLIGCEQHAVNDYALKVQKSENHSINLDDTNEAFLQRTLTPEHETNLLCSDIVCVYVVAFDTRKGNLVEWYHPKDYDVNQIEFKAMASGSHWVQTDFIYFKQKSFFGLACFECLCVPNAEERGVRMKSVGVLATSYTSLHKHMGFLQQQVRQLLEHPGSYEDLEAYYEVNKGLLPTFNAFCDITKQFSFPVPLMQISHPGGCFSQFMNFFGEKIFAFWKLVLLRKRIIIFSPSPIGVVCYRVYSTICLAAHRIAEFSHLSSHPLFYVSVADIDSLDEKLPFIACTTEKIFECKNNLYDLYVDNQNLKSHVPFVQELMMMGPADKLKFSKLCELRSEVSAFGGCGDSFRNDDEMWFIGFFMTLNEHLLNTLLSVSRSLDRQWTEEHMRSVLLDPVKDRRFVMELADVYGLDVIVKNNLCCG